MSLLHALARFCEQFDEATTYWIAYSGGLDSEVLLSLCNQLRREINIDVRAIHINHGLSPHAKTWANHCQKTCERYAINYVEVSIQLELKAGDSLEQVARDKRYTIFKDKLAEGDVLFTAHHENDQAETVLLQLLRGAGPKGLAAMPVIKPFGKGYHARPLLSFPRADLEQYANQHNLIWVEDESNQVRSFARNFIRHEILSKLASRFPSVTATLARTANHCAENQLLLEAFSRDMPIQGSRENTLSVEKLLQYSPEKQRLFLRTFIHQFNYPLPNTKKLNAILKDVLLAKRDKLPMVEWDAVSLRRHRDDIYLVPISPAPDLSTRIWNLDQALVLPHLGVLKATSVQGRGLGADISRVSVRFRQGGEVLDLKARGRHTLKNLFQEWNVLPWERDCMPLIFVDETLIAIAGYFLHEDFMARGNAKGREILFEFAPYIVQT